MSPAELTLILTLTIGVGCVLAALHILAMQAAWSREVLRLRNECDDLRRGYQSRLQQIVTRGGTGEEIIEVDEYQPQIMRDAA